MATKPQAKTAQAQNAPENATEAAEIKHINEKGDFVDEGAPDVAFVVNMGDDDALTFIERTRNKYEVKNGLAPKPEAKPIAVADEIPGA